MIFALVSETRLISPSELYRLSEALEISAAHVAKAYLLERPAIVVIDDVGRNLHNLPPGCFPLLFVEDDGADVQTLGEHWWRYDKQIPVARVIVNNASGLNTGSHSISETASHEVDEAMVNPMLAVWMPHPTRRDVEIAYEINDPRQDHYQVTSRGTPWKMSNFVTPHWWRKDLVSRPEAVRDLIERYGYGLDWCGKATVPGEIGSEGYAVMRERLPGGSYRTWSETIFGPMDARVVSDARKRALRHPLSRSRKLGVQV